MEIERKYLLGKLPDNLDSYTCYQLEQVYITTNPVIRARKKVNITKDIASPESEFILTVKTNGLLMREEYEIKMNEEGYNNVLAKAEGNTITKKRYIVPLEDNLKLELDIFEGAFEGLILGEIEFPDEETAKKYTPPEYISEEVTFDRRFANSTMSGLSPDEISDFIASLNIN